MRLQSKFICTPLYLECLPTFQLAVTLRGIFFKFISVVSKCNFSSDYWEPCYLEGSRQVSGAAQCAWFFLFGSFKLWNSNILWWVSVCAPSASIPVFFLQCWEFLLRILPLCHLYLDSSGGAFLTQSLLNGQRSILLPVGRWLSNWNWSSEAQFLELLLEFLVRRLNPSCPAPPGDFLASSKQDSLVLVALLLPRKEGGGLELEMEDPDSPVCVSH